MSVLNSINNGGAGDLAVQTARLDISGVSWLENPTKVDQVKSLKEISLGSCRLLYGSERFKFYGTNTIPAPQAKH
ncbi:hypothetical protein Ptr902_12892 [Pyrenophora tritici-repentis]|nr:hypothetical protein Ptr902_12892 [Pyrenophora tritici-repentis]